ncbi:MAG: sodium:solute symporter family protein [Singulisphaera sp.]
MFGLSIADVSVLLVYLLGTTALGLWVGRRSRTVAEYFMPRKFSKPVMIMYAFGTGTASDQAVLVAAATFKNGLSGIWYQWLWLFATPFYWIIAPIMRRFRAITTADVYELRYDRGVARLYAAFGIASLAVKTGLLLKGSAVLLEGCTDGRMDTNLAMLAMSVLFVTYGTVGGLTSVILTDFVQGLLTLLFSFMLLPLVMGEVGGMEGIRRTIQDPRMFSLVAPGKIGVLFIVMIGVQALVGIVAQPFVMGTCSAGKTEVDGRVGFMVGNFVKRICTIGWALTAIAALAWYVRRGVETTGMNADRVYGDLARSLLPGVAPGLLGLFIAAMLASVMSSCSAYMITSSALFTENLYRPMVPGRSSSHYIGASRVASVLIVAGGLGFASWLPSLVKGLEIWLSIAPMMGIAFWMGLFWRRTTVAGAWASAIAGFVTWALAVQAPVIDWVGGLPFAGVLRLVWHESGRAPEIYEPWRIIAYLSAGIAAGVGVSLVTRRVDPEKLDLFYALVRTPARPGERVERPCTLPPGTVVPRRRMLLTSFELEVPMPSRTSLLGFAAGWVMVGMLLGGFAWFVRG